MAGRIIIAPPEQFADVAARRIAQVLAGALDRQQDGSIGLTGGTTVEPVYERLADLPDVSIPWNRVDFYFGDERAVPPDHPASNYRLAREALFSRLPVAPRQVHRMEAERSDLDLAAGEYDTGFPASLDLLLLSIGADGHIASLFPGAPALAERERRILPVRGAPPADGDRLTITPRVIHEARNTLVLGAGEIKAAAVSRALEGPLDPSRCPAQLARAGIWILDRGAAGRLEPVR